jgi:hypothetical protein
MVYIAKKNGRVYCGKSLDDLKQFGIAKAEMEISDEEFESAGSMARIVGGKIFIGKTDDEIQVERKQTRAVEIENQLRDIDTKSGRAARAVALAVSLGKTPATDDIQRLQELEETAIGLRTELKTLTAQAE